MRFARDLLSARLSRISAREELSFAESYFQQLELAFNNNNNNNNNSNNINDDSNNTLDFPVAFSDQLSLVHRLRGNIIKANQNIEKLNTSREYLLDLIQKPSQLTTTDQLDSPPIVSVPSPPPETLKAVEPLDRTAVKFLAIDCPSCGKPNISGRVFADHIVSCYHSHSKKDVTSQFGSNLSRSNSIYLDPQYCGHIDKRTHIPCDRMFATCPFHPIQLPKPDSSTPCNCPTSSSPTGLCQQLRLTCPFHTNWPQLRMSEVLLSLKLQDQLVKRFESELETIYLTLYRRSLSRPTLKKEVSILLHDPPIQTK